MDRILEIKTWFESNIAFTAALVVAWIVMVVATLWAGHHFLISIPPDYFNHAHQPLERWKDSHPALRWTLVIAKNLLGTVLMLAGLIMLFTPGQGVLTLLLGIGLMDVPGKIAVERAIVSRPKVLELINRMRQKAKQPPLEISGSLVP